MHSKNLLETRNGRFLAFGLLYISEGIPYGFSSTALVAFMRLQGLSIELIGAFVGALFIPWAFKFAWAPLIDIVTLQRIGGRKAWIVFCTVMMIITLTTKPTRKGMGTKQRRGIVTWKPAPIQRQRLWIRPVAPFVGSVRRP